MSLETKIEYIGSEESPHDLDSKLNFELHDLLSDDADWNDEFWKFNIDKMSPFVRKVEKYYGASKKGIVFSAIWPPDKVENVIEITINELRDMLLSNRVGTKAKYVVTKNV